MKVPPFIRKLKLILQTISPEIAGWNEDGNVFEVCDAKAFANELSRHFKGNEQTFIRQLHFYGFTKLDCTRNLRKLEKPLPPACPGAWSFSHPLLLRDSLDLMDSIVRNSDKRIGPNPLNFESNEDFEDEDNISINSREIAQLRKKNRDLESAVEALQAKLAIMTHFLETEGYDAQALVSSNAPLRKRSRNSATYNMGDDSELTNKRDRAEFELPPSFQRQSSIELFFQSASAINSASSSSTSLDEAIPNSFTSIFDDHTSSLQTNDDFLDPSTYFNPQQSKIQSSTVDALAESLSRNISFDSGFNSHFDNVSTSDEPSTVTLSSAAFKAENLQIDSETVAKVMMHLKEALHAAMNAEIPCDGSATTCTKYEPNDIFQSYTSELFASSNCNDDLRSSSVLSPAPSLMSSSLTPHSDESSHTKKILECQELKGKSMSILLSLLLSLPQIKTALKVNNLSSFDGPNQQMWTHDHQIGASVSAS